MAKYRLVINDFTFPLEILKHRLTDNRTRFRFLVDPVLLESQPEFNIEALLLLVSPHFLPC